MKTLDEVIEELENLTTCDGTGYSYIADDDADDALQYLKWYKDLADDSEAFAEWKENPPLTWDELKSMVGKPVWVEALLYKQWAIIANVYDKYIRFEGVNLYAPEHRDYMGADNGWQAYRKERE